MYLNIVSSLWVDIKVTSPFQLLNTILQGITFMTDPFRIMAQNKFDELVLKHLLTYLFSFVHKPRNFFFSCYRIQTLQHLKVKFTISAAVSTTLHMGQWKRVEELCGLTYDFSVIQTFMQYK